MVKGVLHERGVVAHAFVEADEEDQVVVAEIDSKINKNIVLFLKHHNLSTVSQTIIKFTENM